MNKTTLSPYVITWVEIRAQKGVVTIADQMKLNGKCGVVKRAKAVYKHFANKEKAVKWLETFNKKLAKRYECRLFTDAQFAKSQTLAGEQIIPFTAKQKSEIYTL